VGVVAASDVSGEDVSGEGDGTCGAVFTGAVAGATAWADCPHRVATASQLPKPALRVNVRFATNGAPKKG
jgi:hypothetical protein